MTDRIDHAAQARQAMSQTLDYCKPDDNTEALVGISAAQVHATLAVAEQQRIANLIALSQARDVNGWQAEAPMCAIYDYQRAGTVVRPDIAAALGIEA